MLLMSSMIAVSVHNVAVCHLLLLSLHVAVLSLPLKVHGVVWIGCVLIRAHKKPPGFVPMRALSNLLRWAGKVCWQ
jgi:hypothetical protein